MSIRVHIDALWIRSIKSRKRVCKPYLVYIRLYEFGPVTSHVMYSILLIRVHAALDVVEVRVWNPSTTYSHTPSALRILHHYMFS